MQAASRWSFILLAALLLIAGLDNLTDQFRNDQDVQWGIPAILFGLGLVIPIAVLVSDLYSTGHKPDEHDA